MTPVLRMRKVKAVARVTRKGKERLFELQQKVRAFLLRRTKKEKLAEILPKKQEIIMYCKLTPLQAKIYRAALKSPDFELFTRRHEKCDCGRDMERHECCYSTGDQDTVLWYANHMLNRDPPGACDQCPYVLHIAFLCLSLSYTHTHEIRHCMGFPLTKKLWEICQHLDLLKPRRTTSPVHEQQKHEQFLRQICDEEDLEQIGGVEMLSRFVDMKDVKHCTWWCSSAKISLSHPLAQSTHSYHLHNS